MSPAGLERSKGTPASWPRLPLYLAWPSYLLVTLIVLVPMFPAFLAAFQRNGEFTFANIIAVVTDGVAAPSVVRAKFRYQHVPRRCDARLGTFSCFW